jgi:hypothetical protein
MDREMTIYGILILVTLGVVYIVGYALKQIDKEDKDGSK